MKRAFRSMLAAAAALAAAGAVSAQPAPKAEGIESKEYQWNKMEGEKVEALELKGDPKRGEEAYEVCGACHLPSGSGRSDGTFPQLAGQNAAYLLRQAIDIKSGARSNGNTAAMKGVMHLVTDDELKTITDWLATLQ